MEIHSIENCGIDIGESRYLENIFSAVQWNNIESVIQEIITKPDLLENITQGRGYLEKSNFSLQLYTFIARHNGVSTVIDSDYSKSLLNIITHSALIEKLSVLFGKQISVLRMQLNVMNAGDYVSQHTDYDSDQLYICSVLIRPKCEYSGGDFVLYDKNQELHYIKQPNRSIMTMHSHSMHSVEIVQTGSRHTICLFCG